MYLITKCKKGYRAIPINTGGDWGMKITPDGKVDQRIILRVGQRHYQLYTTRAIVRTDLSAEDLKVVCMDVVAAICDSITRRQDLVDVPLIADAAEKRYRLKHQLDPKVHLLVDYVHIEHPDIIQIGHEPSSNVEQEELPY